MDVPHLLTRPYVVQTFVVSHSLDIPVCRQHQFVYLIFFDVWVCDSERYVSGTIRWHLAFVHSAMHFQLSLQIRGMSAIICMPSRARPPVLITLHFWKFGTTTCNLPLARGRGGQVKVDYFQVRACPAPGCSAQAMGRTQWCKAYTEDLPALGLQYLLRVFLLSNSKIAITHGSQFTNHIYQQVLCFRVTGFTVCLTFASGQPAQ